MLLALADLVGLAAIGDDDAPPAVVAVLGGVLGLITLVRAGAVARPARRPGRRHCLALALRGPRRPSVLDRGLPPKRRAVGLRQVDGTALERSLRKDDQAKDLHVGDTAVLDVLAGALLRHQGGLYMPPLPRWLHHGLMGSLGTVGRWAGKEKILSRYWPPDETT